MNAGRGSRMGMSRPWGCPEIYICVVQKKIAGLVPVKTETLKAHSGPAKNVQKNRMCLWALTTYSHVYRMNRKQLP